MRKPTAVDSNDANVNEALTDTAQAAEASVVKGGSQDEGDREDEVVHADVTDDRQPPEDLTISSDPGLWGDITEELVEMAISKGAAAFQNRAPKYPASVRDIGLGGKTRALNDLLHCCLPNKEVVPRDGLIYSPSAGMVYCFACKLLSSQAQHNAFTSGFCDWRHPERISDQEKSTNHQHSMLALLRRSSNVGTVDASLRRQQDAEGKYWKEVLRRIVAVIKFLSERGLAFRGENELFGSSSNGNYVRLLELIAQFDPFLKEHIEKYGQKGRGTTSYLSSTVCEEFIDLMGEKVKKTIAAELQHAKYFSVIVDSTPDLSHVDQLTFFFRFVSEEGKVVERFIGFEPIHSHTGASLAECVVKMVNDLGLDLSDCISSGHL